MIKIQIFKTVSLQEVPHHALITMCITIKYALKIAQSEHLMMVQESVLVILIQHVNRLLIILEQVLSNMRIMITV